MMPWHIENLIGLKNSSNVTFTITFNPIKPTLAVVHQGRRMRPVSVTPQPGQYEYGINELTIVLGRAPDDGDDLWTRYYYDESEQGLMGGGGESMMFGLEGKEISVPSSSGGGYGGGPYGIEG